MKLRKLRRELHEAADVEMFLSDMLVHFRNRLLSLPPKLAMELSGESDLNQMVLMIQKEFNNALKELSEYDPDEIDGINPDIDVYEQYNREQLARELSKSAEVSHIVVLRATGGSQRNPALIYNMIYPRWFMRLQTLDLLCLHDKIVSLIFNPEWQHFAMIACTGLFVMHSMCTTPFVLLHKQKF